MLQPKDDLAAQEAMFQQQRADYLQHEKDAWREYVEIHAALQVQSQDPIKTIGDEVKILAVQKPIWHSRQA
jgi:hypothetical protein